MPSPPAGTKDRLIAEALRLFADKGFRGTTVVDIEAAAGLSPGSGALYAHFPSKEALLEAAVDQAIELADAGYSAFDALPLGDLRAELTLLARGSLTLMESWRDLLRVLLKEAEAFPGLLAEARARILDPAYKWFTDYLTGQTAAGNVVADDPEAFAAIWLGSLQSYWIQTSLLGVKPAGVDTDRFVAAWIDSLLGTLAPTDR